MKKSCPVATFKYTCGHCGNWVKIVPAESTFEATQLRCSYDGYFMFCEVILPKQESNENQMDS